MNIIFGDLERCYTGSLDRLRVWRQWTATRGRSLTRMGRTRSIIKTEATTKSEAETKIGVEPLAPLA
jgi:hypothetical protein